MYDKSGPEKTCCGNAVRIQIVAAQVDHWGLYTYHERTEKQGCDSERVTAPCIRVNTLIHDIIICLKDQTSLFRYKRYNNNGRYYNIFNLVAKFEIYSRTKCPIDQKFNMITYIIKKKKDNHFNGYKCYYK